MRTRPLFAVLAVIAVCVGAILGSRARADVTIFTASPTVISYTLCSQDGAAWSVCGAAAQFGISDGGAGPVYSATTRVSLSAPANTTIQGWAPTAVPLIKAQNGL